MSLHVLYTVWWIISCTIGVQQQRDGQSGSYFSLTISYNRINGKLEFCETGWHRFLSCCLHSKLPHSIRLLQTEGECRAISTATNHICNHVRLTYRPSTPTLPDYRNSTWRPPKSEVEISFELKSDSYRFQYPHTISAPALLVHDIVDVT